MKNNNLIFIGLLSLCPTVLSAQNLNIKTDVTGDNIHKIIQKDNKYHALGSASVLYTLSVSDIPETDTIDSDHIISFAYKYEDDKVIEGTWNSDMTISRTITAANPLDYSFYANLKYYRGAFEEYTVTQRNEEDTDDIEVTQKKWNPQHQIVEISNSGINVQVYNNIVEPSFTSKTVYYLMPSNSVDLNVNGYSGGGTWKTLWSDGTIEDNYKFTASSTASSNKVTVTVKNIAPDGETEWASFFKTYDITSYTSASIDVTDPVFKVWESSNQNISWTAKGNGGNKEGWEYIWNNNGVNTVATSIESDLSKINSNKESRKVTLTAINKAPDGTILFSDNSYTFSYDIYSKANYSLEETKTIDIYANETATINNSYSALSGYSDGWSVDFSGSTEFITKNENGVSFTFTPSNPNISSVETKSIIVTLKNNAEGSKNNSWVNESRKYTFRVYPTPNATITCNNEWHTVNGNINDSRTAAFDLSKIKENGIPENCLVGDKMTIPVPSFNGDPSTWSWYVNDEKQSNSDAFVHTYTKDDANSSGQINTFVIKVENKLVNRSSSYLATFTINDKVWKTPEISVESNKTFDIYANEGFTLPNSFIEATGYSTGWNVDYTGDTELISNASQNAGFKFDLNDPSVTSMITKTITQRVINKTSSGRELVWLDNTNTYTFRIFPVPSAEISENTTWITLDGTFVDDVSYTIDQKNESTSKNGVNVLVGDKIEIPVPSFTGDLTNWSWYVNDELQSNTKAFTYTYKNEDASDGGNTKIFNVKVINKLPNRTSSFSANNSTSYIVWKTPSIEMSDDMVETYGGATEGFTLTSKGGFRNGWNTVWTDANGKEFTAADMARLQFDPTETTNYKYNVKVTNTCEGKLRFSESKDVTLTVWPKPKSSLKVLLDKNQTIEYPSNDKTFEVKCFDGDVLRFNYEVAGGYISDGSTWSFEVVDQTKESITNNEKGTSQYTASSKNNSSSKETITLRIKNTYNGIHTTSNKVWYEQLYTIDISSWKRASILKNNIAYTNFIDGEDVEFLVNQNYGYPDGWTYSWTDEKGYIISGQNKNQYKYNAVYSRAIPDNTTLSDTINHTFTLHAVNQIGENIGYDEYLTFPQITIWPTPSVKDVSMSLTNKDINYGSLDETTKIELYSDDNIKLSGKLNGGVLNKNCWKYTLSSSSNEVTVTNDKSFSDSSIMPSSSTGDTDNVYTLTISNKPDKSRTWFSKSYKITAKTWALPIITEEFTDSLNRSWSNGDLVDVYAGGFDANNVNFKIRKTEGNNSGWKYEWIEDGSIKSTNNENWTYIPTTNSAYTDKTFNVHIVNSIGKNVALDETKTYKARIWHKADIAKDFTITDNNQSRVLDATYYSVREGNTLSILCDNEKYGYTGKDKSFKYNWSINGKEASETHTSWSMPVAMGGSNNLEKNVETISIGLKADHYGPYGNVWEGSPYVEKTIKEYNKPHTPTQIKKNGNGTTGTMIAITDLSDADLENYDYYLVFGYETSSGSIVEKAELLQSNPGNVRYDSRFTSAEVNNPSNRFFVYAQWCYNDGTTITSGKRYINSVEEKWDGSDYSGKGGSIQKTRSGFSVTGIEELNNNNDIIAIFSLDGKELNSFTSGINIVKMSDGSCKKVIVKK